MMMSCLQIYARATHTVLCAAPLRQSRPTGRFVVPVLYAVGMWLMTGGAGACSAAAQEAQEPVESASHPASVLLSDPPQKPQGKTLSSTRALSSKPRRPAENGPSPLIITPVIAPQIQLPTGLTPLSLLPQTAPKAAVSAGTSPPH